MFRENEKIILKGIGGFYYVKTADGVLEARAKGIFRKEGITPLAGDIVETEESGGDYVVSVIYPRKNYFIRPPVANVDTLFLVVSAADPEPNRLVLDKLTAIAEKKQITPVILFTKTDLLKDDGFVADYRTAGFTVIDVQAAPDAAAEEILRRMADGFSVFSGNSGVGKSTLLNRMFGLSLKVGETSKKLGRGRHTTRAVEIYRHGGMYFADTPGFSAVDIGQTEPISKNELQRLFVDIAPYAGRCRFTGCTHTAESGCAVIAAAEDGNIPKSRYRSYRRLYEEARLLPEWEKNKERRG